jgi:hypothetical protein
LLSLAGSLPSADRKSFYRLVAGGSFPASPFSVSLLTLHLLSMPADYRQDLHVHRSDLTEDVLRGIIGRYGIDPSLEPRVPPATATVRDAPPGTVALYTDFFAFSNFRIPVSKFLCDILRYYNIHLSQIVPLGLIKFFHFEISCHALRVNPSVNLFRVFYKLTRIGDWVTFEKRKAPCPSLTLRPITSRKKWKPSFFFISSSIVPFEMRWVGPDDNLQDPVPSKEEYDVEAYNLLKSQPTALRSFSEHFLVMAGISRNWGHPNLYPIMRYRGKRKLSYPYTMLHYLLECLIILCLVRRYGVI